MIQAGYPPKMLQEIVGHASITTTLDLYGHLYPGDTDRYADQLDSAAEEAGKAKTRPGGDKASKPQSGQDVYLRRPWRARRDSNPQPSHP
jgi:hypothetical protein